jgi:multiple antibiotic resistance protein
VLSFPEYSRFAISLFTIITPFAAVPTFLSFTRDLPTNERSRTATVAAATAASVLVIAALIGQFILIALGTSLSALRVGGGLVLLLEALSMVRPPQEQRQSAATRPSPACGIVPLGLPLLAGPGSISVVIAEIHHGDGPSHAIAVILCIVAICVAVWVILRLAQLLGERIGQCGLTILTRLFGILLAAIAVQIIAAGLGGLIPLLVH